MYMSIAQCFYRIVRKIDDRTALKIYNSDYPNNGGIIDDDHIGKYEVIDDYDLIIYDLTVEDAGIYGCQTENDVQATVADLVVLGEYISII